MHACMLLGLSRRSKFRISSEPLSTQWRHAKCVVLVFPEQASDSHACSPNQADFSDRATSSVADTVFTTCSTALSFPSF